MTRRHGFVSPTGPRQELWTRSFICTEVLQYEYTTHSKGRRRSTKSSLSRRVSVSGKCVEWLNGVSVVGRGEVGKTRWYSELLISQILRLCRYAIGEAPTAFSRNSFKERLSDDFPRVLALGSKPRARRVHCSHPPRRSSFSSRARPLFERQAGNNLCLVPSILWDRTCPGCDHLADFWGASVVIDVHPTSITSVAKPCEERGYTCRNTLLIPLFCTASFDSQFSSAPCLVSGTGRRN